MAGRVLVVEGEKGGGKGGGGGGGSRVAQEAANSLRTKNIARIVDLLGEGVNGGLVDGLKSVFLDGTPVLAADGTANFRGIKIQERFGAPDQDPIEGMADAEEEKIVGVEVPKASPVTRAVTDSDVDAVRVKIQFPALLSQNKTNGDINPATVAFKISRRPDGGVFEVVHDVTINDKTNTLQELGYYVRKPDGVTGDWDWQVERVTEDSESSALQNKIQVGSVTWITESNLYYPYSHVIGVEADAEQFGDRIPERSYLVDGLSDLLLPSNYDPVAKTYDGIWDGTFNTGWSDNPAWFYYNVMARKLWGLGRFITPAQLSQLKWDCYDIGQYCDELVPDGYGGTEPRFTINGPISRQEDAIKVLGSISSVFRGLAFWSAGGMMMTSDRPKSAPRLVNQTNVIGGGFERPGIRHRDLVTSVVVGWNNPDDNYKIAFEVVNDHAAIRRHGVKRAQMVAFLTDSRGQARRVGKWVLASQALEPVVFQAGSDLADLRPGDVVKIMDPENIGVRLGGRLRGGTTEQVELDAPFDLELGKVYTLSVRLPDGSVEDRTVTTAAGTVTALDLSAPLSDAPMDGAVWFLYPDDVVPEMARVLTVTEPEEGVFQFECLAYDEDLFAAVDETGDFTPKKTSLIPTGPLPVPSGVKLTEYLYESGPTVAGGASIEWRQAADIRVREAEVQLARPGDSFKPLDVVVAAPLDIRDVSRGQYSVRIRFLDGFGRRGEWGVETKELYGLTAVPGALTNVRVARVAGMLIFGWDQSPDLDVRIGGTIHIRYSATGAGLGTSVRAVDPLPGASVQAMAPLRAGTYYLFAKDSGKRAGPAVAISTDGATVLNYSSVGTVQADPVWVGTKTDTVIDGVYLTLADDGDGVVLAGEYEMAAAIDLGSVKPFRLIADLDVFSSNVGASILDRAGPVVDWGHVLGEQTGETDARVEVALTDDDPAGSPVWSDWVPLSMGEFSARAAKGRLLLSTINATKAIFINQFRLRAEEVA